MDDTEYRWRCAQDLCKRTGNWKLWSLDDALEHFGLGRYGDAIDINGYKLQILQMKNKKLKDKFYKALKKKLPKLLKKKTKESELIIY